MKQLRILAVDDEHWLLEMYEMMARTYFPEVVLTFAGSSKEAKEHVKNITFDALITDLKREGDDAAAFIRFFKEQNPGAQVFVLTAADLSPERLAALGGNAYLQKAALGGNANLQKTKLSPDTFRALLRTSMRFSA
jgi:CheY-like chemotaxis protein